MDILLIALGFVCLVVGLLGCVIPVLPGPPIAYVAMLLLQATDKVQFSMAQLLFWLVIVIIATVLDYVVPMWGSKFFKGSKWGTRGCFVGTIVGLFFMPFGIIVGPFLGAFVGELLGGRGSGDALLSGIGSLFGFLFGTVLKFVVCAYLVWEFISALW